MTSRPEWESRNTGIVPNPLPSKKTPELKRPTRLFNAKNPKNDMAGRVRGPSDQRPNYTKYIYNSHSSSAM